jgi:cell division protein FtsZ
MNVATAKTKFEAAFYIVDTILYQAVASITQLITTPGLMNLDFAHIRRILLLGGGALMTIGEGRGPNKVQDALTQAIHHPLMEDVSLYNAAGVLVNFSAGADLGLDDINAGMEALRQETGPEADLVWGVVPDSRPTDQVQVILVVTGLGQPVPLAAGLLSGAARPAAIPVRTASVSPSVPAAAGRPEVRRPQAPSGMSASSAMTNPDMPAFLRRRAMLGGAAEG